MGTGQRYSGLPACRRNPLEEMERHNREMRKVRSFIRARVSKNEFEYLYLEHYDRMYRLAESVVHRLRESDVMELYGKSISEGRMVHGDYNYHNVLNTTEGTAVTILNMSGSIYRYGIYIIS